VDQILFRAKMSLSRLDGCVAQQQLDLLKFAATGAAQLRAGSAKVMGRNAGDQRTALRIRTGSVCRHLKIAGRVAISRFFRLPVQLLREVAYI
jgi:hypothetical protein